jgi:N-acetylneuraminic acid mutarotase
MNDRMLLSIILGLGWLGMASCVDEPTAPSTASASTTAELALASNTWVKRRDMPYERWALSTAVIRNAAGQSILYAIGGFTARGSSLGRVQAYNVATNTWTWKRDLPVPLYQMNGAGVLNGKIYITGGKTKSIDPRGPSPRVFMYDPASDIWTEKRRMPEGGTNGVTGVVNARLYVLTTCEQPEEGNEGFFEDCPQSKFFRYNPSTNQWATLPRPSEAYSVGGVIAGKLYAVGVRLEVYDPATNQWTRKASPPTPPGIGAGGAVLNGKLYVMGGLRLNRPLERWEPVRTTLAYNPTTNTWIARAPLPVQDTTTFRAALPATIPASAVVLNGQARLELVGGRPPGNNLQYIP